MITIKKKLIELVLPLDAIDKALARGSKSFHITGWSKVGRESPGWHRRNSERSKKLSYRLK